MLSADYVNTFLFGIYPYICLAVLLIGSLIRFDREPIPGRVTPPSCCASGSSVWDLTFSTMPSLS